MHLMGIKHHFAPLMAVVASTIGIPTTLAINIETVLVGDVGNAADTRFMNDGTTGYGDVAYSYRMGKFEITNDQYVVFLRAVASQVDPYGVYDFFMGGGTYGGITRIGTDGNYTFAVKPNMGNKPVAYVTYWDAARFANWMHNLQPTGPQNASTTEDGAYALNGITSDGGGSIARKAGARWFLPSDDEWYKAAFYDPRNAVQGGPPGNDHYWTWATRSDAAPTPAAANLVGDVSNPGPNVATIENGADWNDIDGNITSVGTAGMESASYYGTFDQSGNGGEWNEGLANPSFIYRTLRSGNPSLPAYWASAGERTWAFPQGSSAGFRLASVLDPPGPVENPGDFNDDGQADGLDFLVWQREFGSTAGGQADANSDSRVDELDLQIWKSTFGASTPAVRAVPEPTPTLLFGGVSIARRRRPLQT
jgi:hypothetical protein